MKRLRSDDETLDRLSELPDSLILEILSFLDMRDVVKTSLLSKRWKYLWITIPCLRFKERKGNWARTLNFVNRTLLLWSGTRLRKFSITVKNLFAQSSHGDMDLWLLFAKERKVEDIYISLRNPSELFPYLPPQCLYECSSIVNLTLSNCNLRVPINLQWNQLKSVRIIGYRGAEGVIDQLVSNAPQLHNLSLLFAGSNQDLIIRSSSLKRLQINSSESDPSRHVVFTIWAPKLESLEILGAPPSKCVLTDVSSLTSAILDVGEKWAAVVGETLSQFLPAIQHVRRLQLSACCFKMLRVMKGKCSFSPFLKVDQLVIRGGPIEPLQIFGLVEHFPNVKKLVVDWKLDDDIGEPFNFGAIEYDANILSSLLLQLSGVAIAWYSNFASIFQFVEILLKHAPAIQKLVLQKREKKEVVELEDMFMAAQKLVSLQRSFPNVELVLHKK